MIFVRDKGRMCNNILQFGHVYAWAREHGRSVMSMRFSYKYQDFRLCHEWQNNPLFYVLAKCAAMLRLLPKVSYMTPEAEGSPALEHQMLALQNVMVEGWYVRFYDLFLKYRGEIIKTFQFDSRIERKVTEFISQTKQEGDVLLGVHIRRGDYKTFMDGRFYYDDDIYISYIRQFVRLQRGRRVTCYVCGNDPQLNEEYYQEQLSIRVVFPDGCPAEDLCLLSRCDYLIGAPSTFSLVAAMYRDLPLFWMEDVNTELKEESFRHFDYLFRHIH